MHSQILSTLNRTNASTIPTTSGSFKSVTGRTELSKGPSNSGLSVSFALPGSTMEVCMPQATYIPTTSAHTKTSTFSGKLGLTSSRRKRQPWDDGVNVFASCVTPRFNERKRSRIERKPKKPREEGRTRDKVVSQAPHNLSGPPPIDTSSIAEDVGHRGTYLEQCTPHARDIDRSTDREQEVSPAAITVITTSVGSIDRDQSTGCEYYLTSASHQNLEAEVLVPEGVMPEPEEVVPEQGVRAPVPETFVPRRDDIRARRGGDQQNDPVIKAPYHRVLERIYMALFAGMTTKWL